MSARLYLVSSCRRFSVGVALSLLACFAGLTTVFASAQAVSFAGLWAQQSGASSPPARYGAALVYDARTGQLLLFGGRNGYSNTLFGDTWTWDGSNWTEQKPASSPSARYGAGVAYDAQTGSVVLFGGFNGTANLNDTWTWDGSNWTQQNPANSPGARAYMSMAYDAQTGQAVLFGGYNGLALNETWTWDGSNWTQQNPATSPAARTAAAMTYDAQSGQLVLFGGYYNGNIYLNDTWTWDGSNWAQQNPAASPSGREWPSMAYDAESGEVVLFGGIALNDYSNDTWIWNGSDWIQQNLTGSPSPRFGAAMDYDARSGDMVLFGGGPANGIDLNDTWELQPSSVNMGAANICPGSQTAPAPCSQAATLTFNVSATTAFSGVSVLTQGAPDLDFTITGTTCTGTVTAPAACTVNVNFAPTKTGNRYGAVVLNGSSGEPVATLYLAGTGLGPVIGFGPGIINTVAGTGSGGYNGDNLAATSELWGPADVAIDAAGNLYIVDAYNQRIRKVTPSGAVTTVAGNGIAGYNGDNIAATSAELNVPMRVAVDGAGNLYIADSQNERIRKVAPSGIITTVAGDGNAGYNGDNIAANTAELNNPNGVALDGAGNLYIADIGNFRVRKVAPSGTITTVAGNGTAGYNGDNIAASTAELSVPEAVALDGAGNLYIADTGGERIRKVTASGIITTVAGDGAAGYNGDNIAATGAELYAPKGVAVDGSGNIYIADSTSERIRKVAPGGIITTVAGNGAAGYNGDNIAASSAELSTPFGVATDGDGNLYIADFDNQRVRKVDVSDPPTLIFPATSVGSASEAQDVTIENLGNEQLNITQISTAPEFTMQGADTSCSSSGQLLDPAATCVLGIEFAPSTDGAISGSTTLTDNNLNSSPATTQSISLSGTANAGVPGAPTIGTAIPGDGQATVSFTPPAPGGSETITAYTVISSPGGITSTGPASPIVVTGLTNGTAYTFTVTATNSEGTGIASAASNTVTPQASQTISFTAPGTQTFGASPTLTAAASSTLAVSFSSATTGVCTVTSSGALTTVSLGTCTIDADQPGDAAYLPAAQVAQSFTIVAPTITVSPTNLQNPVLGSSYNQPFSASGGKAPYTYAVTGGSLPPGLTLSLDGLLSGKATMSGTYTFTITATDSNAGPGPFSGSGGTVSLTVNPVALTITAQSASSVYGSTPGPFSAAYSGFVNSDGPSSLSGNLSCTTTATSSSAVGSYSIKCAGVSSPNYTITFVPGALTVNPAPLTITANNATKVLNAANPSFTAAYSGFVLNQNAGALSGTLACTTTATTTSAIGSYPITCSGQASTNYTINYSQGVLKIQYAAGGACDGAAGHQILPPIDAGGMSVLNQGRTVPAQFRVCDANGASIGTAGVVSGFYLTAVVNGTTSTTVEDVVDTNNPDTAFRFDPTAMEWIFNISTQNLAADETYVYTITLNDGTSIVFRYGLR